MLNPKPIIICLLLGLLPVIYGAGYSLNPSPGGLSHDSRLSALPSRRAILGKLYPRLSHRATTFHRWVGEGLVLVCRTRVFYPPSKSIWKKNGIPLSELSGDGPISRGHSLIIKNATLRDSGVYTCSDGSSTGKIYIFIHPRFQVPTVELLPKFVNVTERMIVELRCNATGVPSPVIIWTRMEAPFSNRVVLHGRKLHIHTAMAADSGTYICIASNLDGRYHEDYAVVKINELIIGPDGVRTDPKQILVQPDSLTGPVGSTIRLKCSTIVLSSPVVWKWQNGPVTQRAAYTKGNRELVIQNAQVSDSGKYSCLVRDEIGGYFVHASSDVNIIEGGSEEEWMNSNIIAVLPRTFRGYAGSAIRLRCNSTARGLSSVEWRRNGGNVTPRAIYKERNTVFIIFNAQVNDSGTYSCIARLENGERMEAFAEVFIVQGEQGAERNEEERVFGNEKRLVDQH